MKTRKTHSNLLGLWSDKIKLMLSMVVFLVYSLLFPVKTFALDWSVSVGTTGSLSGGYGYGYGYGYNPYGLPSGSIMGIISNILFWLLSIFAICGIIGFVLSGIFYLISAGNEGMIDKGKEGMKWSILGILVGLSGFLIMQAVSLMLGGMSKNF